MLKFYMRLALQLIGSKAGKVEAGYQAGLVLLNRNPLNDIRNTKSISAVIANGKYLNRTQLDNILATVKILIITVEK